MSNKGPQSPAAGTPSSSSAASSSRSATKRLIKELAVWEKEAPAETGIERLGPVSEGELLQWEAVINGRGIGGGYDGTSALSIYLCILFATLHFFSIVVVYIYVYLDNQPPNLHSSFLLLSVPPPPLSLFHSLWLTPLPPPRGKTEGRWLLRIAIPPTYPLQPPRIAFATPVVHANVSLETGEICLDLLNSGTGSSSKSAWTPAYSVLECVRAVRMLLASPEPDSPLNVDAAALLRAGDALGARRLVEFWSRDCRFEG